ncbi:hypothetical protein HDU96_004215 [Phlyctochytrium bullatum]|nr:hypothetical protein HDU96_004215 [Phlyctochytrium bullatum]
MLQKHGFADVGAAHEDNWLLSRLYALALDAWSDLESLKLANAVADEENQIDMFQLEEETDSQSQTAGHLQTLHALADDMAVTDKLVLAVAVAEYLNY